MEKKHIIIGLATLALVGGALYLHHKKKGAVKSSADGDDEESSNFNWGRIKVPAPINKEGFLSSDGDDEESNYLGRSGRYSPSKNSHSDGDDEESNYSGKPEKLVRTHPTSHVIREFDLIKKYSKNANFNGMPDLLNADGLDEDFSYFRLPRWLRFKAGVPCMGTINAQGQCIGAMG